LRVERNLRADEAIEAGENGAVTGPARYHAAGAAWHASAQRPLTAPAVALSPGPQPR